MTERRTLGVVGTLVWDTIIAWGSPVSRVEDWGGISYALVAAAATLPEGWDVLPIVKVGVDLEERARRFVSGLERVDERGLTVVPEANNRVELRYHSRSERTERLTGGVPGWTIEELAPQVSRCDAVLVNFISGYEISLETATALRTAFDGPLYADLHSLLLGIGERGTRVPKRLEDWTAWADCFDIVQMNEDEFARCGSGGADGIESGALGSAARLVAVTLGERGVALHGAVGGGAPFLTGGSSTTRRGGDGRPTPRMVTLDRPPESGDPTGCGDVWGAAMFSRLLAGDAAEVAASVANRLAARNVGVSGAGALQENVSGRRLRAEDDVNGRRGLNSEERL